MVGRWANKELAGGWAAWRNCLAAQDAEGAEAERKENVMRKILARVTNRRASVALQARCPICPISALPVLLFQTTRPGANVVT